MNRKVRVFLLAGVAIALTAGITSRRAVAASETEAADSPAVSAEAEAKEEGSPGEGVEVITITSRKRAERLQEAPVSVTPFTARTLGELHITDASGIGPMAPNLMVNRTSSGSTAYVTCMRGLCRTDTTLTDDPYVGIYMNGVYTGKAIGSVFEVADIERIEVIRGPQGTLFGKNTIGGAVDVVTAKPSGEAGVKLNFVGGSYATTNFKAVVDLPEAAGFSTKLAYLRRHHDPYTKNLLGRDLENESKNAVLADLLWEPHERFYADFVFDWTSIYEAPLANLSTANGGAFAPPFVPFSPVFMERTDQTASYQEGEGTKNNAKSLGYALTLNWDIGDLGFIRESALKSITSYRTYENNYNVNAGALSWRNLWTEDRFDTQNASQELQFTARTLKDRLRLLLGFYYLNEQGDYSNHQGFMAPPPFVGGTFFDLVTTTDIEYNSYAVFTEETLDITDELKLSAGVRFTREDREGGHTFQSINGDGFVPGAGLGRLVLWSTALGMDNLGNPTITTFESSTWSPRVILSYQPIEELMIFGGWSRGFKSGGFNARSITAPLWNPYDDQRVDSFELGFKSDFWDNRARLNVTAFYEDISDAQVQFNRVTALGFEVLLANAGDGQIYGAEIEATVLPVQGLELRGGLGITSSGYDKVINPFTGVDEKSIRQFEYSPKYNWNLMGRYSFPATRYGITSIRVDYTGTSEIGFNTNKLDDVIVGQPSYGLLHLRLAVDEIPCGSLSGAFGVAFVARNVTNQSYRLGGYGANLGATGFYYSNVYGPPRIFGGEVSFSWGS